MRQYNLNPNLVKDSMGKKTYMPTPFINVDTKNLSRILTHPIQYRRTHI
jgi:hypothetical protein